MGEALDRGVVLVLSLWDDYQTGMNWLDESTKNNGHLGYKRGPCPKGSGKPEDLRANHPDASVKYGNIKYGEIGSTVSGLPPATSGPPAPAPSSNSRASPAPVPSSNSPSPQPEASSSSAGYCCFGGKENGQAPSCNSECHEHGKADPSSWCAKSEANCKDCGLGVWCPEAKKSSGSLFDWIRKDDESSEVIKEDTLPGQHLHPVLVAGATFAGTGLIALIAAVVIASRARWAQRWSPLSYKQLTGVTAPGVPGPAVPESKNPAQ